jgi:hypothetical protein
MNVLARLLVALLILPGFHIYSQQNDFQAWPSIQANFEIINNFKLHLEEEFRLRENISQPGRQINDLGASYRFNKMVKAGVFYRLEADWKTVNDYTWRKGIFTDLSLRREIKRFIVGYRLRLQSNKLERNNSEAVFLNGFRHRHKISAAYNIKGIPLLAFIEEELFIDYNSVELSRIKGFRTWVGLNYSFNKMHSISLKYGIDKEINCVEPLNSYIISLGYTIDLKLHSSER